MKWQEYGRRSLFISSLACFTLGQGMLEAAICGASNESSWDSAVTGADSCPSIVLTGNFSLSKANAAVLTASVGTSESNPFFIDGLGGPWTITGNSNVILNVSPTFGSSYVAVTADVLFSAGSVRVGSGGGGTFAFLQFQSGSSWNGISTFAIGSGGVLDFNDSGTYVGNVLLTDSTSTIQIEPTFAVVMSGTLSGTGSLTKLGTGSLQLTSTNTYGGNTIVSAGTLNIQNSLALGAGVVTVSSGAQLQVQGAISLGNTLSLNGSGMTGDGALVNVSGTNVVGGPITLMGPATIGSLENTLTITGGITGSNKNLTFAGAGNITVSTTKISLGTGALTQSGTGKTTLLTANTFSGATSVNSGILNIQNSLALGTSPSVTVSSGAQLQVEGRDLAYPLNLSGSGVANNGALLNVSGANTLSGAISLSGHTTIGSSANTLTLIGGISGTNTNLMFTGSGNVDVNTTAISLGSGTLTKSGTGTTTLATANSFSGTTLISNGILNIQNNTALGTSSLVTVSNGAQLQVQGAGFLNALNITGSGVSGTGALLNVSGSNMLSGGISLSGAATIGSSANTLTLSGGITGTNRSLTFTGSGNTTVNTTAITLGTGTLTQAGTGILTLSTDNIYSGATDVSSGILNIQSSSALGTSALVTISSGAQLQLQGVGLSVGNALSLTGSGSGTTGALLNISGINTCNGSISLSGNTTIGSAANTLILTGGIVGSGTNLTFTGSGNTSVNTTGIFLGTGALIKSGSGTLTLSTSNIYSGGSTVSEGILSISADSALGNTTGFLALTGGSLQSTDSFTLSSSRAVTVAGASGIDVTTGKTFAIGQVISDGDSIGYLTKTGAGTLSLSGSNTYSGGTSIAAGVLNIESNSGLGSGTVSVSSGAQLQVQGGISSINVLNLNGSGIVGDGALLNLSGTNILGGTLYLGSSTTLGASADLLTLTGGITGTNTDLSFVGAGNITITTGAIAIGTGTLTQGGTGTVTLSGTNNYSGGTFISSGVLAVSNSSALGAGSVTVSSGAQLDIEGGILFINDLILSGTGVSGDGALHNISGTNTWTGAITLAEAVTIGSSAGSLTLNSGSITGAQNLTFEGAGNVEINSDIATGSGSLTQNGSGTLILKGSNTYSGGTLLSSGMINIQNTFALGLSSAMVTSGAQLQVEGSISPINAVTLNGTGGGTGALLNVLGTNTLSGAITLGSAASIGSSADLLTLTGGIIGTNTNLMFVGPGDIAVSSGSISLGSGSLTQSGSGIVTLSTANTYSGETSVSSGILNIQNSTALGTSSWVTVSSGAQLQIQGTGLSISNSLNLTGAGDGNGALENIYGINMVSGAIVLGGAATIGSADGLLSLNGGSITGSENLTFVGAGNVAVNGVIAIGTGTLTKNGSGTLTLTGTNTYSGTTTVSGGTLDLKNSSGLGSGAAVVASGAQFIVDGIGLSISNSLTLSGTGGGSGALLNQTGSNEIIGGITLDAATTIGSSGVGNTLTLGSIDGHTGNYNLAFMGSGNESVSGSINLGTGSLAQNGTGTLTLSGSNTYSGGTTVNSGILNIQHTSALGSGGVVVANGAQLQVQGGISSTNALTLSGNSALGNGALLNVSDTNTLSGAITLGSATTIGSTAGLLTLSSGGITGTQNLTFFGNGNTTVNSVIGTGAGSLTKNGTGTLTLTGINTYSGGTTIASGIVSINADAGLGATTGSLALMGGTLQTTGAFALSASRTVTLTGSSRIEPSAAASSLTIQQTIADGSSLGSLTKTGSGTLVLSGTNTYSGGTIVSSGILNIQNSSALGSGSVSVTSGAQLQLQGNISPINTLSLNGSGPGSGALLNVSGTNTLSGEISLGSATTIRSLAGLLTLSQGGVTGTQNVTFRGAGNTTVTGVIGTGSGTLTKTGPGTLVLSGTNTYSGGTTVGSGILNIQNSFALGSGSAVISSGAQLQVQGNISPINALTLNGTGIGSTGALLNVSGTNTQSGPIFLEGATIIGSSANLLTLTGGIVGANRNLTFTGSGDLAVSVTQISLGSGTLTKEGPGTLTLSTDNTYSGGTSVASGILKIQSSAALGSDSATVASGSQLQIQGVALSVINPLNLTGVGAGNGNGALENVSGTNTVSGAISLGGATTIGSSANLLTLTGGITGTNTNLTFAGIGNATVWGLGMSIGSGSLIKEGSGYLNLATSNSYSGGTALNQGFLRVQHSSALGSGTVEVASGAQLLLDTGISNTLSLIGSGIGSNGALRNELGANTVSGAISLIGAATIGSSSDLLTLTGGITGVNTDLTFTGAGNITVGTTAISIGSGSLVHSGTGVLTLLRDNTYLGPTNVSGGILNVQNSTALGSSTLVTVSSGAQLQLEGAGLAVVNPLYLTGMGAVDGNGALENISGTNTWSGAIALGGSTAIGSASELLFLTGGIVGTNMNLTFTGAGNITVGTTAISIGSGSLTHSGTGVLTLLRDNTYSGPTNVSGGIVNIQNSTALGSSPLVTVSSGAQLQLQGEGLTVANALNLTGTGGGGGALENISGTNSLSGTITLAGATSIGSSADLLILTGGIAGANADVTFVGSGNVEVSIEPISIGSGMLTKTGAGTLILTRSNTFSGATNVNQGILNIQNSAALGSSTLVTVSSGAALELQGGITFDHALSLAGSGISGSGALENMSDSNEVTGPITLVSNTTIESAVGSLTLSGGITGANNSLTFVGSGNITVNTTAIDLGTGTLTQSGSGILTLTTANTFSGVTNVNSGILNIQSSGALGTSSLVTVFDGAELELQGGITLDNALILFGVGTGGGGSLLNIAGDNSMNGAISLLEASTLAATAGTLSLNGGIGSSNLDVTFTGAGNIEVSASSISLGTGSLIKNGTGTLTLFTDNTYLGSTLINSGVVNIQSSTALGTGSVLVANGATLQIQGGISASNAFILSGTGVNGTGALLNLSGDNTISGAITLAGPTTIGSIATTLTLSGGITGSHNLTVYESGSGNVTISNPIQTGAGTLTKNGSGILTLSAANTFSGGTVINEGTVVLSGAGSLLATAPVTLNGDAIFDIQTISGLDTTIGKLSAEPGTMVVLGSKTLVYGSSDNSTVLAMFVGTGGSIIKEGSGMITLPVSNSYNGGTFLNEGGFVIGNDSSLGTGPVSAADGTRLVFADAIHFSNALAFTSGTTILEVDGDALATVSANILGLGGFVKTGTGFLNYTGMGSNTGSNIVDAGTLYVNGSVGDITVSNGAVLGGSGQTGNIYNHGVLAPGNSCGNLMAADVEFFTESLFSVYVGSTCNSTLEADSVVIDPGATVRVHVLPGYNKLPNTFTFLTANSISGQFSGISINSPLLQAELLPPLEYSRSAQIHFVGFPSILGSNNNALSVGQTLMELFSVGNQQAEEIIVDLIRLETVQDVESALNQMQPALLKGFAISQENNIVKIQDTLGYRFEQEMNEVHCYRPASFKSDAISCEKEKKTWNVWGDGFGDVLRQDSTTYAGSPQLGYQNKSVGVSLGLDGHFAEYLYAGALGSYTDSSVHWNESQGKGTIQTGYGGLYFSAISDMFYGNLSVIGGWSHYKGHRNLNFSGVDVTATSAHGGSQLLSHADTGINLGYGGFTLRPFDSFDYIVQTEGSFTETGAGVYNLHVQKTHAIMLRNELGLQLAGCVCFNNSRWTIAPKISWVREVRIQGEGYTVAFAGTDVSFQIQGYFPDRSLISPGVMVTGLIWEDRLAFDLYYNGEFGHKYTDHNYGGQIRFGF